jgi:hypothetical protein
MTMVLGLMALLRTLSRGGWLSFACGFILLLCLVLKDQKRISAATVAIIPLACLVLYLLAGETIAWRYSSAGGAFADSSRASLNWQALQIIAHNPVFGVGAGNYDFVMWQYALVGGNWQFRVHNAYLLFFAECGAVGFLWFIWLLYAWAMSAIKCAFSEDRVIRAVGVGVLCYLATKGVHWFFEPAGTRSVLIAVLLATLAVAERGVALARGSTAQLNAAERLASVPQSGMTRTGNSKASSVASRGELESVESSLLWSPLRKCGDLHD